jgi:hypothetical protein
VTSAGQNGDRAQVTGKRSAAPQIDEAVAALGLHELDDFISRLECRVMALKLSAFLQKSAMQNLVWIESERESFTKPLRLNDPGSDQAEH